MLTDVPEILTLIRELAAYEREPDAVVATAADLQTALFGEHPRVHCLIAEVARAGEKLTLETAGFAIWFENFSTWRGRHGIYLEDLYVRPEHRGCGHGKALLAALAGICADRRYPRLEWAVLDWNTPAINFYRAIDATPQDQWTTYRLSGDALQTLAATAPRVQGPRN